MPKTYTAAGSATAGDVYTASAHNVIVTDVNNLIVPPIVRLTRGATQSINNVSDTFVTWPTEVIDTDGCYTATSDTVTIQTAGVYQCNVGMLFAANATGIRVVALCKNPSGVSDLASRIAVSHATNTGASTELITSASCIVDLAVSDTLKVVVYQTSGGALNVGSASLPSATHLSLAWIGRTS